VVELGPGGLFRGRTTAQTWTATSWLVAHAASYGISTVSVSGMSWPAPRGTWKADPRPDALVWS
ncbi:MAG: hypothetical protein ABR549_17045, partial [Mycobacteriales bacterium]